MSYPVLGQTFVFLIVGSLIAWGIYKEYQELGIRRRTRDSLRTLLNSSNEDWAITHRQWLSNRRSSLELKLSRDALIDVAVEECEGWHDNMVEAPPREAA